MTCKHLALQLLRLSLLPVPVVRLPSLLRISPFPWSHRWRHYFSTILIRDRFGLEFRQEVLNDKIRFVFMKCRGHNAIFAFKKVQT